MEDKSICNRKDFLRKLGKTIKKLREHRGITQEELAYQASLHRTYISLLEKGERNPSILTLCKVSSALNTHLSEIFKIMEDMKSD